MNANDQSADMKISGRESSVLFTNVLLALLRDWQANTPEKLIDFTRYDLKATEPSDPQSETPNRNWSLMNRLNQKGTRPQDKPIDISELNADETSHHKSFLRHKCMIMASSMCYH